MPATYWCTLCSEAIFDVTFTSDYTSLLVSFFVDIEFPGFTSSTTIFSNSFCVYLLNQTNILKLGTMFKIIFTIISKTYFENQFLSLANYHIYDHPSYIPPSSNFTLICTFLLLLIKSKIYD